MQDWILTPSPAWPLRLSALPLGLFFINAARLSWQGSPQIQADFKRWHLSDLFRRILATSQLILGIGLLVPTLIFLAAILLCVMMTGAVYLHVRYDIAKGTWIAALCFFLALLALAYFSRPLNFHQYF